MGITPPHSRALARLEARSLERKVARHDNVVLMRPPEETQRLFEELGPRRAQRARAAAPRHERALRMAAWAIIAGWAFAAFALAAFHDHSGTAWVAISAGSLASVILLLPTRTAEKAPQMPLSRVDVPKRASGAQGH